MSFYMLPNNRIKSHVVLQRYYPIMILKPTIIPHIIPNFLLIFRNFTVCYPLEMSFADLSGRAPCYYKIKL